MPFHRRLAGEPEIHDEPQHVYQGAVMLLEDMDIYIFVIDRDATEEEVEEKLTEWKFLLNAGKQTAFIVGNGALEYDGVVKYANDYDCIIANRYETVLDDVAGKVYTRDIFKRD